MKVRIKTKRTEKSENLEFATGYNSSNNSVFFALFNIETSQTIYVYPTKRELENIIERLSERLEQIKLNDV